MGGTCTTICVALLCTVASICWTILLSVWPSGGMYSAYIHIRLTLLFLAGSSFLCSPKINTAKVVTKSAVNLHSKSGHLVLPIC